MVGKGQLMKSKKWRKPSVSRLYLCRGWGAWPVALAACGHSGVVVMPRYLNGTSDEKKKLLCKCILHREALGELEVTVFHEY
jgi:hypothetical protein